MKRRSAWRRSFGLRGFIKRLVRARWRSVIPQLVAPAPVTSALIIPMLVIPAPASGAELKIATWNLDWLTLRQTGDPGLPPDVKTRQPEDFARLAQYAARLKADVIALQEVDGYQPASQLFPRDAYALHFTHDHVTQRVGFAIRRGLPYDRNPDLTALSEHHLRSGADITLHLPGTDLRMLAVHLKKGCREVPMNRAKSQSCLELKDQLGPLTDWAAARRQENVPFLILGDFNRWMDGDDSFMAPLAQAAPLTRATAGHTSPCWGKEAFIDHIMAGGPAAGWLKPDSLRVLVYQEIGPDWHDRLSDHCPVSVRLTLPD
jgi:endonuclease/exonuclease/phosphatase family metal-dependent hydrolase